MSTDKCYHCGDDIIGKPILTDDHEFCCNGCKSVYMLLNENALGNFYQLEQGAGIRPSDSNPHKFAFLDVENIREKIIEFEDDQFARVNLFLPSIHCSSCIYLLENSPRILPSITNCQINFAKREASIVFAKNDLTLSELALFLDKIGYTPNFGNRGQSEKKIDKQFMYKLGIAGFAFGSIMLWSFPEYLGIEGDNPEFRNFTAYLSFAVSIPVLFYSSSEYFISAFKALRYKSLNLDVPITIGIIALYAQSAYSILAGDGPGYMDSFAGFIFFLLIGKWFQNKTYKMLSFERDYTSYFPLAVTRLINQEEEIVEIEHLKEGDTLLLRNEEVLPCDATLISEEAKIDYSFVTGESNHIIRKKGDFIYAGGKLLGQRTQLRVDKESNRSQLTRLWNEVKSEKKEHSGFIYQNKLSLYFLIGLLILALGASIGWIFIDPSQITRIVVSILIVACPCALALSAPFTFGNVMRMLGRKGLYLKNTGVIERINEITDIVFDKTGTLTTGSVEKVEYVGDSLSEKEKAMILTLANSSTHPLSRLIVLHLRSQGIKGHYDVNEFTETQGKGVFGVIESVSCTLGSAGFSKLESIDKNETATYIRIGDKTGRFIFSSDLREGLPEMISRLKNYRLHVLSGDKDSDKELLEKIFPSDSNIHFEQSPKDKLDYIKKLMENGKHVMMIGDGLNDAGALGKADVGIAVSEDVFRFTPSSDAIIEASKLSFLDDLLTISNFSKTVLTVCLIFSLSYNVVGLSFAISGNLSPLIAAILMPISSITVVLLSTLLVLWKKGN
jgi:P-type Cu+ transporter